MSRSLGDDESPVAGSQHTERSHHTGSAGRGGGGGGSHGHHSGAGHGHHSGGAMHAARRLSSGELQQPGGDREWVPAPGSTTSGSPASAQTPLYPNAPPAGLLAKLQASLST